MTSLLVVVLEVALDKVLDDQIRDNLWKIEERYDDRRENDLEVGDVDQFV